MSCYNCCDVNPCYYTTKLEEFVCNSCDQNSYQIQDSGCCCVIFCPFTVIYDMISWCPRAVHNGCKNYKETKSATPVQ
jgi:hypothetical protein